MSFFELITLPKRSTRLTQPKQSIVPIHKGEKKSEFDSSQQIQLKQLALTSSKNIFSLNVSNQYKACNLILILIA